MTSNKNIIEINHLKIYLGGRWVHNDINLVVREEEIFAIVGDSGSGKSVLLRQILGLLQPSAGYIKLFNQDIQKLSTDGLIRLRQQCGVMFQQGALFSALTVLENVAFPLNEHSNLDKKTVQELAMLKILAVGLSEDTAFKYPAELSGGMQKRVAIARACVLDPKLLFLDEPTAGLDPQGAAALDELVLNLKKTLGLTIVMVTHDMDSLWKITDQIAFLSEGKVLETAPIKKLIQSEQSAIKKYFSGPRSRITATLYTNNEL